MWPNTAESPLAGSAEGLLNALPDRVEAIQPLGVREHPKLLGRTQRHGKHVLGLVPAQLMADEGASAHPAGGPTERRPAISKGRSMKRSIDAFPLGAPLRGWVPPL